MIYVFCKEKYVTDFITIVICQLTNVRFILFRLLKIHDNITLMKKKVQLVYCSLYGLNLIIILFISFTICLTIYKIIDDDKARNFLEAARYLPHIAWQVPIYSIISFLLIGLTNIMRFKILDEESRWIPYFYIIDLFLLILISYTLNFSYNGYFLFLIAGLFLHSSSISTRLIIMVLALGSFIIFDYDLFTVRMNMLSFQDYVEYYKPSTKIYLYSIKSISTSINLIMIILHFYLLINSKIRENKEFIHLNNTLKKKLMELEIANEKLEEAGKMKERNRLAHEIHDILGHSLTCISMGLEASLEVADDTQPALNKQLLKIKKVSDKGLRDIRRSVRQLKQDVIDETTLITSIKELVDNINILGKQKVNLQIKGPPVIVEYDEEFTVYRLIQESLTNSIRHGKAEKIDIHIEYLLPDLYLAIKDNGTGCSKINNGFGLSHMKEQVKILGGKISYKSNTGKGFQTSAIIPLRRNRVNDKSVNS